MNFKRALNDGHVFRKKYLKVMHDNIALLSKKVTNHITYILWKVMLHYL